MIKKEDTVGIVTIAGMSHTIDSINYVDKSVMK